MAFAEAEETKGADEGSVFFGAGEDADGGGAGEAFVFDVPAVAGEDSVARGGEGGDVGHLGSGNEGEAGRGGEVEDFFEPSAGGLFDDGGCGGAGVEAGILIPGGGEPVGSERGGERTADDPAEETASGGVDDAALDLRYEIVEYDVRVEA